MKKYTQMRELNVTNEVLLVKSISEKRVVLSDEFGSVPILKELKIGKNDIDADPKRKKRVDGVDRLVSEVKKFNRNSGLPPFVLDAKKFNVKNGSPYVANKMDHSRRFYIYFKEQEDGAILKEKLKGKLVVDLGCGAAYNSVLVMRKVEAKWYVGVDEVINPDWQGLPKEGVSLLWGDMLSFAARLPDKSVNFIMNGIDSYITTGDNGYWQRLAKEVYRATEDNGILAGAFFEYERFRGFERIVADNDANFYILQKKP